MKFKFFGMTILTGKSADAFKEVQERIVELGESLEKVGDVKQHTLILAHAKAQLDYKAKMRQEIYAQVAEVVVSGGLMNPGHSLERVVSQALDELCDLRNWKAMEEANKHSECHMLRQKLDELKVRFEGAVDLALHHENLDKQKSLALRLVLHEIGDYAGNGSRVGSVALFARRSIKGSELLAHEKGHPAILDASPKDRAAWDSACETVNMSTGGSYRAVKRDKITGTFWDQINLGVLDHTPPPGGISKDHQAMADYLNVAGSATGSVKAEVIQAINKEIMPGGILHSMRNECR